VKIESGKNRRDFKMTSLQVLPGGERGLFTS